MRENFTVLQNQTIKNQESTNKCSEKQSLKKNGSMESRKNSETLITEKCEK